MARRPEIRTSRTFLYLPLPRGVFCQWVSGVISPLVPCNARELGANSGANCYPTMTADRYGHLFPRSDDGAELAAAERGVLRVRDA
jgi:hypothetical protein